MGLFFGGGGHKEVLALDITDLLGDPVQVVQKTISVCPSFLYLVSIYGIVRVSSAHVKVVVLGDAQRIVSVIRAETRSRKRACEMPQGTLVGRKSKSSAALCLLTSMVFPEAQVPCLLVSVQMFLTEEFFFRGHIYFDFL